MNKAYFSLYFALVLFATNSFSLNTAGDPEEQFSKAESLFNSGNYAEALALYIDLDNTIKESYCLKYKIGVCYLQGSEKEKAIPYLEAASQKASDKYKGTLKDKYAPIEVYEHLAKAYHYNYQFDKALSSYSYLLAKLKIIDGGHKAEIDRQIQICKNGKEITAIPVPIKVDNLGPVINSIYADYSPVFNADESTLMYTSRRKNSTGGEIDEDGQYYEDIYVSYKTDDGWTTPLGIGPTINTSKNEATVALSIDGQSLILRKNIDGNTDLFTSKLEGSSWAAPKKLGDYINTDYDESCASISADGADLYFTSNMPGGFGGMDIYRSKKLPNGEWGRPINLGPVINSKYDEEAPYIHPDGFTLFFSSKGHKTIGGYDIFFSSVLADTGGWTTPLNMGFPVNSTDDDIYFAPTVGNKRAYYSSFKKGGYGGKDIYMITFSDQKATPLTVYKGVIKDKSGKVPDFAAISIMDKETNEIIGDYYPNTSTGRYLYILTPGKSYIVSYTIDGEEIFSNDLFVPQSSSYGLTNKAIELKPIILSSE